MHIFRLNMSFSAIEMTKFMLVGQGIAEYSMVINISDPPIVR